MHITISANRTTCIVLAVALGAHVIGYMSQIVKPAFAQQDTGVFSTGVTACMFRNLQKIQNVSSTRDPNGSPFAWLQGVCQSNPDAH